MNYWSPTMRTDDRKEDKVPYSRLFVVCSKQLREEDLKPPFERYGDIEDLFMPRDRNTGELKGVAYIKYSKTSSAAAAIQEMHMKTIGNENKPIKVMVASNKNDYHSLNEDRYRRLFIKVHKQATESDIRKHFANFGRIESVYLQRDKNTDECKGFAYVIYKTFLDTAKAFEECDRKYRPVFATPKDELKRSRNSLDNLPLALDNFHASNSSITKEYVDQYQSKDNCPVIKKYVMNTLVQNKPHDYNTVIVTCTPQVSQIHIEKLFNIIPGMLQCQYTLDTYNGFCKAVITYEDGDSAAHAVERIHNFEYPSGEIVSVKPDKNPLTKAANDLTNIVNNFKNAIDNGNPDLMQLAEAIAQASTLIKAATTNRPDLKAESLDNNFCNISLPPLKPIADGNSRVAQRCFIVCKPQPPPISTLRDVFCRFGDLIDVSTFPNKTFGFAKYASVKAAQDAIKTLNGVTVCGVKLKVLQADEKPNDHKMQIDAEQTDISITDRKRMKLDDHHMDI